MRVVPCVSLLAVGLGLAGCRSIQKPKPAPTASVPGGGSPGTPFWADPNAPPRSPGAASIPGGGPANGPSGDPVNVPGNDPEVSGILAGRLVDSFGRPPGQAFIQVAKVGDTAGAPIDIETTNQGYFYIPGLQPGRPYRLVARTKMDGRMLVGEVQARPPETRLVITMSEDLAGTTTPPIPGAPQPPRSRSSPAAIPPPQPPWSVRPTAELGPPRSGGAESGPAPTAPDQAAAPVPAPPPASIPAPVPVPPPTASIQPQSFAAPVPTTPALTQPSPQPFRPGPTVPACLIVGRRVQTLTLADPDGQVWDISQRRGRLILLDFWGTWCGPCLRAIPELSRLQSTYGPQGLEVIGIACEKGTPAENARRVRDIRQKIPALNYRVLMADQYGRCPVQAQFQITQYPTLVLLDADGTILWGGGPDQLRGLEQLIRRRLGS